MGDRVQDSPHFHTGSIYGSDVNLWFSGACLYYPLLRPNEYQWGMDHTLHELLWATVCGLWNILCTVGIYIIACSFMP